MSAPTLEKDLIAAGEEERPALERVADALKTSPSPQEGAILVAPSGEKIPLPSSLYEVLERAARDLTRGEAVAIVPIQKQLTTHQAADFLNMSRQYLVRLLDSGVIPFTKVGTHRRVKFGDILNYQKQLSTRRRQGLEELTRMSVDLGLYEVSLGDVDCRRSESS